MTGPEQEQSDQEWQVDDVALEAARKAVEDVLIERRDARMFVIAGNGLTVRESDGSGSEIMRLRTVDGLHIGIRAYLNALASTEVAEDAT